jgi:hypothetical protein
MNNRVLKFYQQATILLEHPNFSKRVNFLRHRIEISRGGGVWQPRKIAYQVEKEVGMNLCQIAKNFQVKLGFTKDAPQLFVEKLKRQKVKRTKGYK